MANPRSSKRQLEKDRREKAAAKRERRRTRAETDHPDDVTVETDDRSQQQLLDELAALHERHARDGLTLEEFEARKNDLVSRIRLD